MDSAEIEERLQAVAAQRLFVGNLPPRTAAAELAARLAPFGVRGCGPPTRPHCAST